MSSYDRSSVKHSTFTEQDLSGLFAPRRVDADAFRTGIEERIAELEAASAATAKRIAKDGDAENGDANGSDDAMQLSAQRSQERMTPLRRAAGLLPIGLFPTSSASVGLKGSSFVKFTYSALALPATVLALAIAAFIASSRSVLHLSKDAVPSGGVITTRQRFLIQPANQDLRRGGQLLSLLNGGTMIAVFASFVVGGPIATNILCVALLIAMAALVLIVRGLATAKLLSREEITRLTVGLLMTVYVGCFLWLHIMHVGDRTTNLGIGWSSSVVLLGIVACLISGWSRRAGALGLLAIIGLSTILPPPFNLRSPSSSVRTQLSNTKLIASDISRWEGAAALFRALEATGEETPDMQHAAQSVAHAIETGRHTHPVVYTAAARMNLIDNAQWKQLASTEYEANALDSLVQEDGFFMQTAYYEYQIPMLLASRDLSPSERSNVIENIEQCWNGIEGHGVLERAAMLTHVLDLLGRSDLVDARREEVHEMLVKHWVIDAPGLFRKSGGFTPNPDEFFTSFPGDTLSGIELMSRLGVPEAINMRGVRSYLRPEARSWPLFIELSAAHLRAIPRAALLRAEGELGIPSRSWLANLIGERLLIASLLLVALCLLAIRVAPPFPVGKGGGAQP